MSLGGVGVAAGPSQIADGTTPTQLLAIDSTGAVKTQPGTGIDDAGTIHSQRVDPAGRTVSSDTEILRLILAELRVISVVLAAGLNVQDDLGQLRSDPYLLPSTNPAQE